MESVRTSEVKCPVCDGHGEVDDGNMFACRIIQCGNCEGKGTVDWIRKACPLSYDDRTGRWK